MRPELEETCDSSFGGSPPVSPSWAQGKTGEDLEEAAAIKIQAACRRRQARNRCNDIRKVRLNNVVNAINAVADLAKEKKPAKRKSLIEQLRSKHKLKKKDSKLSKGPDRQKTESEHHAHLEMSEASVSKAKAMQMKNVKLPWTASNSFNLFIGFFICLNAACLGAEADYGLTYPTVFLVIEHCFTAIFFLELIAHLWVSGPRIYFQDGLNWLDSALVTVSVVDVWIIRPIGVEADLRMMSIFRMLRLIRLARLLRLIRMFKELTLLVQGFIASVRTLGWALLFLLILVYAFALFARNVFGNGGYEFNEDVGDAFTLFGTVDRSMLTLFVCLTEGCGLDIVHPTVREAPLMIAFWAIFIFFTTYGLLNLIVGCFCENAMKSAAENEKEMLASRDEMRMMILRHMKDAFNSMDTDGQGTISKAEFTVGIMENQKVMDALSSLGLHEEENLFETLDADKEGVITFDQFFEGALLIMKGQESAKAKDLVATHLTTVGILRRVRSVEYEVRKVKRHIKELHLSLTPESQAESRNALVTDIVAALRKEGLFNGAGPVPPSAYQMTSPSCMAVRSPSAGNVQPFMGGVASPSCPAIQVTGDAAVPEPRNDSRDLRAPNSTSDPGSRGTMTKPQPLQGPSRPPEKFSSSAARLPPVESYIPAPEAPNHQKVQQHMAAVPEMEELQSIGASVEPAGTHSKSPVRNSVGSLGGKAKPSYDEVPPLELTPPPQTTWKASPSTQPLEEPLPASDDARRLLPPASKVSGGNSSTNPAEPPDTNRKGRDCTSSPRQCTLNHLLKW
eukprot:gnl/MRDRNA2_/MRDRNA2_31300_c0_seq1.p1 gnl/MRDRNA2_/MRDRNA2_31300_c0~~gnl/MRDRNA2_/MRDRNA2_31300_c0_seq1.p1  ORF type:complete len:792 (+),score=129.08 gnl/MRDRNA2_/MRDRNA2_31300_c0_seq1:89-2464(+)